MPRFFEVWVTIHQMVKCCGAVVLLTPLFAAEYLGESSVQSGGDLFFQATHSGLSATCSMLAVQGCSTTSKHGFLLDGCRNFVRAPKRGGINECWYLLQGERGK